MANAPRSLQTKIASAKQISLFDSSGGRSKDIIYSTKTENNGGGEKSEKEMMARFDEKLEGR